jgi:P27 family predicted phage terminase small subunit
MEQPEPEISIPDAPDHLDADALAEWGRIATELYALGLLTRIDRAALAAYCITWSRWAAAERDIKANGATIINRAGDTIANPSLRTADAALAQLKGFIGEFGLSPSARTRVHATPPDEMDELSEFNAESGPDRQRIREKYFK